jgi:hypothetical protein
MASSALRRIAPSRAIATASTRCISNDRGVAPGSTQAVSMWDVAQPSAAMQANVEANRRSRIGSPFEARTPRTVTGPSPQGADVVLLRMLGARPRRR